MRRTHIGCFGRGLERLEARDNPSGFGSSFTFTLPRLASGTVFADTNGNGVRDAGEGGVNGLTVYLDANNNGVRDAGERSTVTNEAVRVVSQNGVTTTTREPGYYLLSVPRTAPNDAVLRVDGATQTTTPPTVPGALFAPPINLGVTGVTASPPSAPPVVTPSGTSSGSVTISSSSSASVSVSASGVGSSSASVSASSSVINGVATVSVFSSTSGNAQVSGSATAGGLTIYVG